MNEKKNIWVLGGTGFIGSYVVEQLSHNPHNLIHLLVHKNVPYRKLESCNIFKGSLEKFDYKWLKKYTPDIIFHLARLGGSNSITRNLASRKGARANLQLINFLSGMPLPPTVVYVSGSLMYGNQLPGAWANESAALRPISYARYYIQGENPWLEAQATQLLDVRFARPGWIVGPGSWFKAFYWDPFIKTGKIPIYGEGRQLMSLVYIEDCAKQIIKLAENDHKSKNLNIFSGLPISQKMFAETLAQILNARVAQLPVKKLIHAYGRTATEALTSSIPLKTEFPEIVNTGDNGYLDTGTMLRKTISLLKY